MFGFFERDFCVKVNFLTKSFRSKRQLFNLLTFLDCLANSVD